MRWTDVPSDHDTRQALRCICISHAAHTPTPTAVPFPSRITQYGTVVQEDTNTSTAGHPEIDAGSVQQDNRTFTPRSCSKIKQNVAVHCCNEHITLRRRGRLQISPSTSILRGIRWNPPSMLLPLNPGAIPRCTISHCLVQLWPPTNRTRSCTNTTLLRLTTAS